MFRRFESFKTRSAVICRNGMVATSQPVAALVGLRVLMEGGNAVDAAVATAAALNVLEPMSIGIGGDMFAIAYICKSEKLIGINASGRSPYGLNVEELRKKGYTSMPDYGMIPVTVPGALDGWVKLVERFGEMPLSRLLEPAIRYAEDGFAVTPQIALSWASSLGKLSKHPNTAKHYLINGRAPKVGELFRQPHLARTLRLIAEGGKDPFYEGEIAEEIVRFSEENGGYLSMEDFKDHSSEWVEPVCSTYRGFKLYELPPNCQGITAQIALNIVEGFDLSSMGHNSADYLHLLIESTKLAFADRNRYIADPGFREIPVSGLISKRYADERRGMIDPARAIRSAEPGDPMGFSDTAYLCVVDSQRNAVSFINSLFHSFGSGMVGGDTGILLQNRGASFSLDPGSYNSLEPHKRPMHTIIPAMLFKDDEPVVIFGVMGGDMQPQGHLQVVCNLVDFDMNVQDAIDAPRFRYMGGEGIALEEGISEEVTHELERRGHKILPPNTFFGGGQAIFIDPETGSLHGGSDHRRDGCAVGY